MSPDKSLRFMVSTTNVLGNTAQSLCGGIAQKFLITLACQPSLMGKYVKFKVLVFDKMAKYALYYILIDLLCTWRIVTFYSDPRSNSNH